MPATGALPSHAAAAPPPPPQPQRQQVGLLSAPYLENGDDGPEQGVEVLPVGQSVAVPLGSELAAKEVHPQNAVRRAQC